jgi:hypothetical protein
MWRPVPRYLYYRGYEVMTIREPHRRSSTMCHEVIDGLPPWVPNAAVAASGGQSHQSAMQCSLTCLGSQGRWTDTHMTPRCQGTRRSAYPISFLWLFHPSPKINDAISLSTRNTMQLRKLYPWFFHHHIPPFVFAQISQQSSATIQPGRPGHILTLGGYRDYGH